MRVISLLFSLVLLLASCEKEPVEYNASNIGLPNDDGVPSISINGKWKLISGRMYFRQLEGMYATMKYDHFDGTKKHSSMRYGGSLYRIEELYVDSTIWEFNINEMGNGYFILDGDTTQPYGIETLSSSSRMITENLNTNIPQRMGGSAKPFLAYINDIDDEVIDIIVNEAYTNIDGINYRYHNVLQFKKQ